MKYIYFLILPFFLYAKSSFITPMEYASQFYKNPRGIGCEHCHGENGEGKLVASYVHKKEKKTFEGPPINSMSFDDFHKALSVRKLGMPRYFLTKKEVEALYFYVNEKKGDVANDKK